MDERDLIRRLERLAPPDLDAARARAELAARARHSRSAPVPAARWRRTLLGLLACSATMLAFALSGPGQALAAWIGREIGLGHPGGAPSLHRLRAQVDSDSAAHGAPAYVLARGPLRGLGHYEFVGYRSSRNGEPCFELDLPATHNPGGRGCGALRGALRVDFSGRTYRRLPPLVSGRVASDAQTVEVTLGDRTVSAMLDSVSREAEVQLGLKRPFKVFVAFLPPSAYERSRNLTVTSRGPRRRLLAEVPLQLPRVVPDYGRLCDRLRDRGKTGKALRTCGRVR
jgi:hypothetical protein